MLRRHVSNWHSVVAVYLGFIPQTFAKFKDGQVVRVSKNNYNFFYESLYRRHCAIYGFKYEPMQNGKTLVHIPGDAKLILPEGSNSFVLDEIFIMKVYGEPTLYRRPVIDIGASIGDSSIFFALQNGEIYAFEPDPQRYKILLDNIQLNGFLDRIHPFNQKVSGASGPTSLENILIRNSFVPLCSSHCFFDFHHRIPIKFCNKTNFTF